MSGFHCCSDAINALGMCHLPYSKTVSKLKDEYMNANLLACFLLCSLHAMKI